MASNFESARRLLAILGSAQEETEAWLHQSQQRVEEEKLRDPDDVYITVRQREAERHRQKLPPRIQFLDETQAIKTPTAKRKTGKSN